MFENLFSLSDRRSRLADEDTRLLSASPAKLGTDDQDRSPLRGEAAYNELLATLVAALALDQAEATEAAVPEARRVGFRAWLTRPFRATAGRRLDVKPTDETAAVTATQTDADDVAAATISDSGSSGPSRQAADVVGGIAARELHRANGGSADPAATTAGDGPNAAALFSATGPVASFGATARFTAAVRVAVAPNDVPGANSPLMGPPTIVAPPTSLTAQTAEGVEMLAQVRVAATAATSMPATRAPIADNAPGSAPAVAQNSAPAPNSEASGAFLTDVPVGTAGSGTNATRKTDAYSDHALRADTARSTYGIDGGTVGGTTTPIKIGILSDSFNALGGAAIDEGDGDLPTAANVKILKDYSSGEDEGRAMADLIHRVAPGAQIDFYSGEYGQADMAAGIKALQADGCQIIVDDLSYYQEPFYQADGTVQKAIDAVTAKGVTYFTSINNNGHDYYEQSSWSNIANYTLPGITGAKNVANVNGGSPYETFSIDGFGSALIDLQWAAPFKSLGGAGDTYTIGIAIYDVQSGTPVLKENFAPDNIAVGNDPTSINIFNNNSSDTKFEVAFYGYSGAVPTGAFKATFINSDEANFTGVGAGIGSGATYGHNAAADANPTAAVYYGNTPANGGAPANESFSSEGGTVLYYDANGNAYATPVTLKDPAFSATDGDTTSDPDITPFFGTSAAAPNAAACGALCLAEDGRLTNVQITYALASTAQAFGNSVYSGAGLINADAAVALAQQAATTPIWTAQDNSTNWSDAANWSDDRVPGASDTAQLTNGIGTLLGSYSVTYDLPSSTIAALDLDGGTTSAPSLTIGAGDALTVTGTVTVANNSTLAVSGTLSGGAFAIRAGSTLSFGTDASVTDTSLLLDGGTLEETTGFATGRTLTIGTGGATLRVDAGIASLSSAIAGGNTSAIDTFTKTGTGTLVLGANNSGFAGNMIAAGGILSVGADANLGAANRMFVLQNGTLKINAPGFSSGRAYGIVGNGTIQVDSGTATLSGIGSDGNQNGNGVGALIKTGAGTLVLAGTNGWTRGTTIVAGTLSVGADGALGAPIGRLTLGAGALEISADGFTSARDVRLTGNAAIQVDTGTATLSGAIQGVPNTLTKTGGGTLLLSNKNDYGSTIVSAGEIDVSNRDGLGPGAVTLDNGTALGLRNVAIGNRVSVSGSSAIRVTGTGDSMPSYTGPAGTVTNILGTDNAAASDVLTLTSANSSYAGTTDIGFTPGGATQAVTLRGGATNAFGPTSAVALGAGSALDLGGYDQTVGTLASDAAGDGAVTNGGASGQTNTLTIGTAGATSTFSGQVQDGTSPTALAVGAGTLELANAGNSYSGGTTIGTAGGGNNAALLLDVAGAAGTGAIAFAALSGSATATLSLAAAAQPGTGQTFGNALANFDGDDLLDLNGFADGIIAYDPVASPGTLVVRNLAGQAETFTLTGNQADVYIARSDGNGGTIVQDVPCYCTGTRIRIVREGSETDVAVEHLRVGDLVVTAAGAHRPIRWIGSRPTQCRRHPEPRVIMPVRILAHAFGPNRPARDLSVSPGHSLCVDVLGEVLIPAVALINGTTVVQEDVDHVTYWHVELDSHDVILAENMPAESYLEMGNRGFFAENGVVSLDASPDAPVATHADFCRPFHAEGALVQGVRAQLAARAAKLGWRLEDLELGDLHLLVDGARIKPRVRGLAARFAVPAGAKIVWLVSGSTVPAEIVAGSPDHRALGVCVAALVIDDGLGAPRAVPLDDPCLCVGFHDVERDGNVAWRWTCGHARLPASLWEGLDDDTSLRVNLAAPAPPRWIHVSESEATNCFEMMAKTSA